jgi:hypothetical protein
MALGSDHESVDGFFLAMAHWQLGAWEEARHGFDRAVQCMDKNKAHNVDLRPLRVEAAALLGIAEPPAPK